MIVLYVFLALVLAILLLLCLPIRLLLQLNEQGDLRVRAKLGIFSLFSHPATPPRFSVRRYSPRAVAKRQRKEMRRLQKKQAKLAKRKKAAAPASNAPKPTLKQRVSKLKDTLSLVTSLIDVLHERLFRATHIHVHKLSLTIGADDAAATALLYGALSGALNLLIEVLHQSIHLHMHHPENMRLQPDFLNKGLHAELDIRIHMRVYHAVALGLRALIHVFKHKTAHRTPPAPVPRSTQ